MRIARTNAPMWAELFLWNRDNLMKEIGQFERALTHLRACLVRGDREAFGLHGRSAEQRVALDLLLDPEVGIVSLGGRAGTGKSALAMCAQARSMPMRSTASSVSRKPAVSMMCSGMPSM